jgi:hypothetical protein
MISRPTTAQLLEDAARELRNKVLPAVSDPAARIAVEMLEQLVRSCGVRAATEIAWMRVEEESMIAYASEVGSALSDPDTLAAIEAWDAGRTGALTLDEVCADYSLAGAAMSAALTAAMAAPDRSLSQRAQELMCERMERETIIRGEFSLPGRG